MDMNWTLAEAMAMAVIRRDMAAAYALADRLKEEMDGQNTMESQATEAYRTASRMPVAYEVYGWPEFLAFAKRLGLAVDLRTRELTIRLPSEGAVEVRQDYVGTDMGGDDLPVDPPDEDFRTYE